MILYFLCVNKTPNIIPTSNDVPILKKKSHNILSKLQLIFEQVLIYSLDMASTIIVWFKFRYPKLAKNTHPKLTYF